MAASPRLVLVLLYALCLALGSMLQLWFDSWEGSRKDSANVLNLLIGDSRTMLANHFFAKADAYFHKGYYPSIFDTPKKEEESHMGGERTEDLHQNESGEEHHEENGGGFLEPPRDWIDRFSRNFFPSQHSHLEQQGEEREILPWLRISADLDPHRIETYTIASYWLRSRLNKVDEAEQFLREGLKANPDSYEIYFELGRIYDENRREPDLARNLWEVALRKWNTQLERSKAENNPALKPDDLVYDGITARLARIEEENGNFDAAIHSLHLLENNLRGILDQPKLEPGYRQATEQRLEHIQKQIEELAVKKSGPPR